jgi:Na+-driven multidrug efflux pump
VSNASNYIADELFMSPPTPPPSTLQACVSNASNYILDEVFMFRMGGGMAGCGWASVVSQVRRGCC